MKKSNLVCVSLNCTSPRHGRSMYCVKCLRQRNATRDRLRERDRRTLLEANALLHEPDATCDPKRTAVKMLNVKTGKVYEAEL